MECLFFFEYSETECCVKRALVERVMRRNGVCADKILHRTLPTIVVITVGM